MGCCYTIRNFLLFSLLLVGKLEEDETKEEEYRKTGNCNIYRASCKLDPRYNGRAEEGCALAENIIDAEILTGVLGWDYLGVVGTGKRLNGALEAADAKCKDTEMQEGFKRQRVQTYGKVADYADKNEICGAVLFGKLCKHQRKSKENKRRYSERRGTKILNAGF